VLSADHTEFTTAHPVLVSVEAKVLGIVCQVWCHSNPIKYKKNYKNMLTNIVALSEAEHSFFSRDRCSPVTQYTLLVGVTVTQHITLHSFTTVFDGYR